MAKAKRSNRGRKAIGPKPREVFSVRMDSQLRKMLEKSAKKNSGGNVSRELEKMLFAQFRARSRDKRSSIRALCFLIEKIAEGASASLLGTIVPLFPEVYPEGDIDKEVNAWRTDPFRFRAFEIAVAEVLRRLRPAGEIVSPWDVGAMFDGPGDPNTTAVEVDGIDDTVISGLKEAFSSPESLGAGVARGVWMQLTRRDRSDKERELLEERELSEVHRRLADKFTTDWYGMKDAQGDLGLAPFTREGEGK